MSGCVLCPRECNADRTEHVGFCGAYETPNIARAALHFWEEPPISGTKGSGAVFFSGCNLGCIFCQNNAINHTLVGESADAQQLSDIMLSLERHGAHNINLVSPAPFVRVLCDAIPLARSKGLSVPIVYNTNAYEKVETLRLLEGMIEIYLPDLKYMTAAIAQKYSRAADYADYAVPCIDEMARQCGMLETDRQGIAVRGLLIRHLVLPGSVDETRRVIDHVSQNFPHNVAFSLMGQYVPNGEDLPDPLKRKLLKREYERAIDYAIMHDLTNVFIQDLSSADKGYTPEFDGSVI